MSEPRRSGGWISTPIVRAECVLACDWLATREHAEDCRAVEDAPDE